MSHIQRGYGRGGDRFANSHLIKDLSPHKLSRYGAKLIRSGAAIMTQAATESIKGGQSSSQQSDSDNDEGLGIVSQLGLNTEGSTEKPRHKPKTKQDKTKQTKKKQTRPKQIKTKQNKTKQNKSKLKVTKVLQKQKASSIKRPVKSVKFQPRNIFD